MLRTPSGQPGLSHRQRNDDHQITSHNIPFESHHQQLNYDFRAHTSSIADAKVNEQTTLGDHQGSTGMRHDDMSHIDHFNTGVSHHQLAYSTDSEQTHNQIQVNNTSGRRYYQGLKSKQIRELRRMCRKTANRSQYEKRTVQLRQVSTIECLAVSAIPFLATGDSALRVWMKNHRENGAEWTDEFPLDKASQCELRQWDQMLHNLVAKITTMNNSCRIVRDSQQRTKNTRYMAVGVVPGSSKSLHTAKKNKTGSDAGCDPQAEGYSVVCVEDDSEVNSSRATGPAIYSLDVSGPPQFSYHVDETKYETTPVKQKFGQEIKSVAPGVPGGTERSLRTQVLPTQLNKLYEVPNVAQSKSHSNGPETNPLWHSTKNYSHQHSSASQMEVYGKICESVPLQPTLANPVSGVGPGPDPGSTSSSSSASNTGSWSIVSADSMSSVEKDCRLMAGQIAGLALPTFGDPSSYLPTTKSVEDVRIPLNKPHIGISDRLCFSSIGCQYDEIGKTGTFDVPANNCLASVRTPGVDITNMKNMSANNHASILEKRPSLSQENFGSNMGLNYVCDEHLNVEKSTKIPSIADSVQEAKKPNTHQEVGQHGKVKSRFPLAPRTPVSIPISYEPNPFDPSNAHDQEEVQARPDLADSSTYHLFGPSFMEKRQY